MKIITSALITLIASAALATDHGHTAAPTATTKEAAPAVATAPAGEDTKKCTDAATKNSPECKDMAKKAAKKTK